MDRLKCNPYSERIQCAFVENKTGRGYVKRKNCHFKARSQITALPLNILNGQYTLRKVDFNLTH